MYGRADDRAGGNIFGGAWGWHLGYEAYLARKARADDMIKHFPCIDNKEDDEIFGYVNESLQALKDKIYDEVLFDSFPYKIYEHDVEQIRTDVNAACDSLINLKTAYAQSSGDIESDSYNQALQKFKTNLANIEELASQSPGRPSRVSQAIYAAVMTVGAALAIAGACIIVLSALAIPLSLGGSTGGFVVGAFLICVGLSAFIFGLSKIVDNSSQSISHRLRLFGDSLQHSQNSIEGHKKTFGETLATPFKAIYRNCIR